MARLSAGHGARRRARRRAHRLEGRASWWGGRRRRRSDVRLRGLAIAGAGVALVSALTGSVPSEWATPASGTTSGAVSVRVPRSPAELTAVDAARRTAQASAYFAARRADADAVAAAAREAAAAALFLDPQAVPADLVAAVHSATATLDSVAAPPEPGSHRGDVPVATTVSTMEATAAELFRLSEQVRAATEGPAPDATLWSIPSSLVELESLAATADQAAARFALGAPVATIDAHPLATGELCPLTFAVPAELRCDAAMALELLAAAYRADTGRDLVVTSAFRPYAEQVQIKASRGWLAAAPGTSNHERGVAVDLAAMGGLGEFTAPAYLWMKEHAAAFGWHHPSAMEPGGSGPPEPWHWEYAG